MARKSLDIYIDDIARDYKAGMSEKALAEAWGVARTKIRRLLLLAGIKPRNRSEAMYNMAKHMSFPDKQRRVAAANEAARGRKASLKERKQRAKTCEKTLITATAEEHLLAGLLKLYGLRDPVLQKAIGPYNCDIFVDPVAVEVLGGGWHWYGRRKTNLLKKIRYFLDRGYSVLMLVIDKRRGYTVDDALAEYVVAYVESVRSSPSMTPEYRMVRGANNTLVVGSADDKKISIKPMSNRRLNTRR